MKAFKMASLFPLLFLLAGTLLGATKYGDAVIQKGKITVLREGRTLKFDRPNERIQINEKDLIRVREASRVVLSSRENAELTLGANAVFHVKPWRARGKTGFVRALFGRFRASITGLLGGNSFNVKTASATIGVKGTDYVTQVTNRAGTLVVVRTNQVGVQGQRGPESNVNPNQVTVVINFSPPTPPVPVPPEVSNALSGNGLDSPPPNSPNAGNFVAEGALIRAGIVNQRQLNDGKGQGQPFVEVGGGFEFPPPGTNFDPNEASKAARGARVNITFP